MIDLPNLNEIQSLLQTARTIAIVGLSPKEVRPSNMVARYLIQSGYTVIPVNPGHNTILGLQCHPSLRDVPDKIDIVDIFRRTEEVPAIVKQAIQINAKAIWMQQGIIHYEAADTALKNNIKVVMDRCIKVDHFNLMA